jgi:hypothetical protein
MPAVVRAAVEHRLEDEWHPARLIPTTGIGGQDEQEQRATSSLLAVIPAVPSFGRALLAHLGAPAGKIYTYAEVRFKSEDEKVSRPDGAIVVERGQNRWRCLVEVKTSSVPLRVDQVTNYVELARLNDIQAVLTISNQITGSPLESPVAVEPRRLKKVTLRHLSWWHILTEAIDQHRHKGITDPDQAWILGELIAYLDNERSGASGFDDLGDKWVSVRDGARSGTLRPGDAAVRDVGGRWEQFIQHLALGLRQDLGRDVTPNWPRKLDAAARREETVRRLAETGRLEAAVKVPDAVAPLVIDVDLRARQVTTSVEIAAPKDGRARTRVTWLLRQLRDAPPALRIDAAFPLIKETTSELLASAHENPDRLLMTADPRREPRTFKVAMSRELGMKRGKTSGSFVYETKQQVADFYRLVVQRLKPWQPGAPKLPSPPEEGVPEASPRPPDFTAPTTREPGEGLDPEEVTTKT